MRYDRANRKISRLEERVAELSTLNRTLETDQLHVKQVLDSTMHEVRRFSLELSADAERLSKFLQGADQAARELCDTIFYTSGMISSRMGFTDLELNPSAVSLQSLVRAGIYKKFDKAARVLAIRSRARSIPVRFNGTSFVEISALPSFDLVPFVILENAIKYSPRDQAVAVNFASIDRGVRVSVSSLGPLVEKDELPKIFDRGNRGRNAERVAVSGEGLGLYLAKFLCDFHDIEICAKSGPEVGVSLNGIPYATFEVMMGVNGDNGRS